MPTMINENPFRAAGTFNGVSYIERDADRELYKEIVKNRRYLYFLAPRQSGKSSLISHIRGKLDKTIFKSVLIDLSTFPANCLQSENSFNDYFVSKIYSAFNLEEELENKKDLKKVLEKVMKKEDKRILIFVDEIDRLSDANFKDSWFGLIRSFFNCRATEPDIKFDKLQFILSGAATVTSLISNKIMSPFNVGKAIGLYDFTYEQTIEITKHLEKGDWAVFENAAKKIYEFTSGSVYLGQLILEKLWDNAVDRKTKKITEEDIEKTVNELIIESPNNIHFNTIFEGIVNELEINDMFIMIIEGHPLTNVDVEGLKRLRITGILNEKDGYRNRIYKEVFDENGPLSLFINKILKEKLSRAKLYLENKKFNEGLAIIEDWSDEYPEIAIIRQELEQGKIKEIDSLLDGVEKAQDQKNWKMAFDLIRRAQALDSSESKVRSTVERLRDAFAAERHEEEINKKKQRAQALLNRTGKSIQDIETAIRFLEEIIVKEPGELDAVSMLDDANRLRSDFLRSKGIIATLEQASEFEDALEKIRDLIQRGFSQYESKNIFDYRNQLEKKARIFADQKAAKYLKKAEDEFENNPKLALNYIERGLALPALPKTREDAFNELKLKVKHAIEKYEKVEKQVKQVDQLMTGQKYQQAVSILENALAKIPNFPGAKYYLDQARQGLKDKVLKEARIAVVRVEAGMNNENIGKSRKNILAVMDTLQLDGEEARGLRSRCKEILEKIKQLEQREKELQKAVERAVEALEINDFTAAESEIQSLPKELQKRPEMRSLRLRMTRKQDIENALDKVKQLYEDDQLESAREQIKILRNRDRQHQEINQLYNEIEGAYQYNKGVEAYNEVNLKDARKAFKKIIKIGGDLNDEAHEYLQKLDEMSEQDRQAKQFFKTAQKHTEAKRYKEAYQILTEIEGIPSTVKQKAMELRATLKVKWRKELIRKINACLKTNGYEEMMELVNDLKEIRHPEDNKLLNYVSKSYYIHLAEIAASQQNWHKAYRHWQEAQKYDVTDERIQKGLINAKKQNVLYEAEAAQNEKEVIRILENVVERQPTNLTELDAQIDERLYHAYLIIEEYSKALSLAGMRMRLNAQFSAKARSIREFCLKMKKSKEKFQRGAFSESFGILSECQSHFPEYFDIVQEISERRTDDIINKLLAEAQDMERKGENDVRLLAKYREIISFEPNHRLAKEKHDFLLNRFNRNVSETIKGAIRVKEDENVSSEEVDYLITRINDMVGIATEDQKARLTSHLDSLTDKLHRMRRQNLEALDGLLNVNRMNPEALEKEERKLREDAEYDFNFIRLAYGLKRLAGKYRSGAELLMTRPEPPRSQPAEEIIKEAESLIKQWGEKAKELDTEVQEILNNQAKVRDLVDEAGKMINEGKYVQAKQLVEKGLTISPTDTILRHYNEVIKNALT